jgi:NAD(P)-dependent dehydrogenase (short-subunit alcohol dehydrogenase family)
MELYNASKFNLEGLSETLASEVKAFEIHMVLKEPNGYAFNIWHTGIITNLVHEKNCF